MFVNKLSVPWPPMLLTLVSAFSVFSFDLVSLTNLSCAFESNYYDTFKGMMAAPIFVFVMAFLGSCFGRCMMTSGPGKSIWQGYSMKIFSIVRTISSSSLSLFALN